MSPRRDDRSQATIFLGAAADLLDRRGIDARQNQRNPSRGRSKAVQAAFERLDRLTQLVDLESLLGPFNAEFALSQLADPWRLTAAEIQSLEVVYRSIPDLARAAVAANVDLANFFERLGRLDYAERLALVDRAAQFHAARERDLP